MSGGYRAAGPDLSRRMTSLMIPGPLGVSDQVLQTMEYSALAQPVPHRGRARRKADVARQGRVEASATAQQVRPLALRRRLAALPGLLMAGLHWSPRGGLRGGA